MGSNHNDLVELHLCTVCMMEGHTLSLATGVLYRVAMYICSIGWLSNIRTITHQQCHFSSTTYVIIIMYILPHLRMHSIII